MADIKMKPLFTVGDLEVLRVGELTGKGHNIYIQYRSIKDDRIFYEAHNPAYMKIMIEVYKRILDQYFEIE